MKMKACLLFSSLFVSLSSFAGKIAINDLKCVADTGGTQRIEVDVKITMGSAPEEKIQYNGNTLAVGFFPGDRYEGQQVLTMELNGYSSRIYDPKKSLYVLEAPNTVKIQCYIDQQ